MIIEKILKTIWNELIYGGHAPSLVAVSIVYTASILLGIKITWDFLLVVYLGTGSVFLYNRFKEYKIDFITNPERTEHIKKRIKIIPLIIFFFALMIFLVLIYYKNFPGLIFASFLLLMGLLYSEIFKGFTQKIVGFKNFFVSLMEALLIIFLAIYYSLSFNLALFLIFAFVFLRMFVNTSFFDIKDIESDKKEGLLTLAIIFGQKRLINILSIITILAVIPIIFGIYLGLFPFFSLILLFTIPYTFYYFKKLQDKKMNNSFLYNVVVEGEFILWAIFILLGKIFFYNGTFSN